MAGNKVNKAKGKYDKSKGTAIVPPNEEAEDHDFSLLRKPIQTSITGLGQAKKIFDLATEELKKLLSNECDVLYECKVCRNIFRSLANFISHKRVYCKDVFTSNQHGHFIQPTSTAIEMKKIQTIEDGYQESLKGNNIHEEEDDERIPLTKDLTSIIEKLAKNKSNYNFKDVQVALQEIPSTSVAVFQNIENGSENESENMLNQVSELDKIMSKDMGVMQSDGNFKVESSADMDNVIQISDDEETADTIDLKCKICDMQFSTQKTLKFHMKYKHVESRLVYPCPDCLEIFSTSWSVYRHLFKVHRKTPAQIRRLRESIQAKAFKMNNPPAFYERRKNNQKTPAAPKITEEERIEQENQAWMDNMEFDGEISRCGGCGRTFERRAALAAHAHTCQPRSRALSRRTETKRIEIQIRKDYNKGPNANLALLKPADTIECKVKEEIIEEPEKESLEKEPEKESEKIEENDKTPDENSMDSVSRPSEEESNASESPEKVEPQESTVKVETTKAPIVRLPFAQHAEKSNLMALRQRIIGDIELVKLLCKRCNTRCEHIRDLYDHVATHYKWMRYACKLCNFKNYHFEQLPEHVKTVHKLKGDKDFYFSTVKALDGAEALEISEDPPEETIETENPESRRPSRCSSDSSRLSDDSSSSSAKVEGTRKRKVQHNNRYGKRKRESLMKNVKADDDNDSSSNLKTFEENSSDIDEVSDRIEKRTIIEVSSSVASRRPVRRKAKPKNEDFEYDLSNLLKMEAQGYRENQTGNSTTKSAQAKKKPQQETINNYEMINKECLGAMDTLSRKAVEQSKAAMKTSSFAVYSFSQKERPTNIFVRPLLPKAYSKAEKNSPKKEAVEEKKENSPNKETKSKPQSELTTVKMEKADTGVNSSTDITTSDPKTNTPSSTNIATTSKEQSNTNKTVETSKNKTISSVVPIKFRRQSLDVIKNPIINKNIKDFTKAGMKTKILVIKPIKLKDGTQSVNSSLKFQTIKLKDSNRKSSLGEDKSDQVVVVKVPNVDRNVVLSVQDSKVIKPPAVTTAPTEKQDVKTEADTVQSAESVESTTTTNKDAEPITELQDKEPIQELPNAKGSEFQETKTPDISDKTDKSSEINLLCDEDVKNVDLTITSVAKKPIVVKIDSKLSSSNGLS